MAESRKIFCEPCEHDGIIIEATTWCNDCCEGFCGECIKGHKLSKILRNHHVITITEHLRTSDLNVSQTCAQHAKPFDSFCPQYDQLLCLKCVQLHHNNCGDLLRIEEAVKGVKTSTALTDLDEQITALLRNLSRVFELNTDHKKILGDQKEAITSTINDTRARINMKLDQIQKNLLDELETKYGQTVIDLEEVERRLRENEKRVVCLHTQLNGLKTHGSDMQTFIGMKKVGTSLYSEKNEVEVNMKNIHSELQLRICTVINSFIDDMKEFGEIILQHKYDDAEYIAPQNSQAQSDVAAAQVFDITKARFEKKHTINLQKSKSSFEIQGCVVLNNHQTVFTDYSNKRLVIHDQNGIYKEEIRLSISPKNVAVVDQNEVVVSYTRATSYLDIINLTTHKTMMQLSCNSKKWHSAVCFHDGHFFVSILTDGIKQLTRDGVLIKQFLSRVDKIGRIGVHGTYFYYSKANDRFLYCTDLDGNPMWKFSDERLDKIGYATRFTVDGHGNVYVACYNSDLVLGISFDGTNHGPLLTESDGLDEPTAISFDKQNNRILVCNNKNGKAFVFDLKG